MDYRLTLVNYMPVDKLRHCSRLHVVLLLVAVYNVSSHGLNTVYHVDVMQYVGRGFARCCEDYM